MEVVLALIAALLFSLGTVLQQQVAAKSSEEEASSAGFLLRLARQPRWLAGVVADGLGFAAQAGALAIGRLVVVQPLLATTVVFSLPLNALLGGRRPKPRELAAAVAVTAGLALFLVAANPEGGKNDASGLAWIVSFAVIGVVSAALTLAARGRSPRQRAALLGIAAGIMFGLAAALTKATVERLDEGFLHLLGDWHVYALIIVAYLGLTLSQSSFQTGALAPAVATQMAFDPIASVLLGVFALDETIHESTGGLTLALVAFAVVIAGLVYLAGAQQKGAEPGGAAAPA